MDRFNKFGAPLSVAVLLFFGGKLVRTYGRTQPASAAPASTAVRSGVFAGSPILLAGGQLVPALGTSCAVDWSGTDGHGKYASIKACNCFESVNYMTSGDEHVCIYRSWPMESVTRLDDDATWTRLEQSLKFGDVVEFVAHIRTPAGVNTQSNLHAQMCAGEGSSGLMIGANNEPRFTVAHGIPTATDHWDTCTSREYYMALRSMDDAWKAVGYVNSYQIRVFRRP